MMKKLLIILIVFFFASLSFAQQQEIPFTLADRDRLIKLEANMKALSEQMDMMDKNLNGRIDDLGTTLNGRIDDLGRTLNGRIDDLDDKLNTRIDRLDNKMDRLEDKFDTYFTWGFGLVLMSIFILIGFIIWDRRSTIAPVKREQDKILKALRDLGKEDEKIKEALKKVALW